MVEYVDNMGQEGSKEAIQQYKHRITTLVNEFWLNAMHDFLAVKVLLSSSLFAACTCNCYDTSWRSFFFILCTVFFCYFSHNSMLCMTFLLLRFCYQVPFLLLVIMQSNSSKVASFSQCAATLLATWWYSPWTVGIQSVDFKYLGRVRDLDQQMPQENNWVHLLKLKLKHTCAIWMPLFYVSQDSTTIVFAVANACIPTAMSMHV